MSKKNEETLASVFVEGLFKVVGNAIMWYLAVWALLLGIVGGVAGAQKLKKKFAK